MINAIFLTRKDLGSKFVLKYIFQNNIIIQQWDVEHEKVLEYLL
jgi:hypothetical protein